MNELCQLSWLPSAPEDFSARCKALAQDRDEQAGRTVRALANYRLDLSALNRLARVIDRRRAAKLSLKPMTPFRLAIVSNATTSLIGPPLVATAARYGFDLEVIETPFGTAAQQLLEPDSMLFASNPDAVLIALDHRGLPLKGSATDPKSAAASVEAAIGLLVQARENVRKHSKAVCIFQTIPRPVEGLFGSFDRVHPGSLLRTIENFNGALAETFSSGDIIFDAAALAETVGLADWHDPGNWHLAKLAFSPSLLPLYADHVCRLIGALRGKSRRCLILDLDNTLWGGVIGDDGLEGIKLGNGDALGEAFLAVQRMALDLRGRGIVLAVASKNDESRALEPFRSHSEMILREEHIAVMRANWEDKAANIRTIAETLSLGLESMVFLDDNPAERALVRQFLPEVAVPELPDDPALYPRTLWAAGYFETIAFSDEDSARADFYQRNAKRTEIAQSANNLDDYLRSLDMTIQFAPFDAPGRGRITQLINKSNQFNLTTRRYGEPEVRRVEEDPDYFTLQVRLVDTFGDNGMISVIICERKPAEWQIDTWLMSCRVLKRRVEEATLSEIVRAARAAGAKALVGRYIPTERNGMVREHYGKLGFSLVEERESGETIWRLALDDFALEDLPMRVERTGLHELEPA